MKYSKQDLPKILVLSAILLLVLVYIAVSYGRLSAQHRERIAARERAHQAAHQAAPAASQPQSAMAASAASALLTEVPAPESDPFRPVIARPRSGSAATGSRPAEQPSEEPPTVLPPLPTGTTETLHVTGIVMGRPSVAVMRIGEDHFIVEVGDTLSGGLRVQSIARSSVTLRDEQQRTYVLRLGG
jgi:hypothetical protein